MSHPQEQTAERIDPQAQEGTGFSARHVLIAALCGLSAMAAYLADVRGSRIPVAAFLPIHIALELSSIVVSFAVFVTGWFGCKQTGSLRDLIIAVTFATTGALDFVHTLSYKGMPDFLGVNSPGKAAAFWLIARAVVGTGLVAASIVGPKSRSRRALHPALLALAGAVVVGSCVLIRAFGAAVGTALYPALGRPPSLLKAAIEYGIIALYVAAFVLVSRRRGWDAGTQRGLHSALIFAIAGEILFTVYLSPYAWINALGHVFKTASYILILNALFVSAIRGPYEELAKARDELNELYLDAREHRAEMERSFARIGSALSSSLKLEEALDLIAGLAEEMLHVDCVVVVSMDRSGETARIASQKGICHKLDRPVEVTMALGERVLSDRAPLVVNDVQSTGLVDCDFKDPKCLRSAICAPMVHEDSALGVIAVYSYLKSAFEEGDVKLLEGFASHAAVAVHNAMSYQRESRIADVLQRSFLSTSPIRADRFEIAQVYQPAMDEALVGGDFYDVYEPCGGKVALVIGDVSGKGLTAAVHTAMVKFTLRAYLNEGHPPAEALRLLNRAIERLMEPETFITIFVGLLDTVSGELTYANAGHEPPLYSCGESRLTLPSTGLPLGVDPQGDYEAGRVVLEPGCVLLLYTDGISEARKDRTMLGTEGVIKELDDCRRLPGEDIARCIHRRAIDFAGGELRDDAAILAVRARE